MDAFDDIFNNMEALMEAELLRAENDHIPDAEPTENTRPVHVEPDIVEVINILDKDVQEAFIQDVLSVGYSAEWFTKPAVPTVTLDGTSSGILFHEEQLISFLEASPRVLMFTCNFGKVIYPGYTPPIPAKKRKKEVTRRRKVQGDGSSFNSQISCFVARIDYTQPWAGNDGIVHHPKMTPDGLYYIIPTDAPHFEYKIFRNGRLQLPGATLTTFDEGIAGAKLVQRTIWEAIGNYDVEPVVTSISSVMINFKFVIKLRPRYIADLAAIRSVLMKECKRKTYGVSVNLVKYSRQKQNLSAEIFVDGTPGVTRVNIYLRGKVNIIGVKIPAVAAKIFDFLHMIFATTNEPALTRREGGVCYIPMTGNLRPRMDPVNYANFLFNEQPINISDSENIVLGEFLTTAANDQDREIAENWQRLSALLSV